MGARVSVRVRVRAQVRLRGRVRVRVRVGDRVRLTGSQTIKKGGISHPGTQCLSESFRLTTLGL